MVYHDTHQDIPPRVSQHKPYLYTTHRLFMDTNIDHTAIYNIKKPKVHFSLTSALKPRSVPQLGNQHIIQFKVNSPSSDMNKRPLRQVDVSTALNMYLFLASETCII